MEMKYSLEDVADIISDTISGVKGWKVTSMELDHNVNNITVKLKKEKG